MYSVQCLLRYEMISHKLDHVSSERDYSQDARRPKSFSHRPEPPLLTTAFHQDVLFLSGLASVRRNAGPNSWSRSRDADDSVTR